MKEWAFGGPPSKYTANRRVDLANVESPTVMSRSEYREIFPAFRHVDGLFLLTRKDSSIIRDFEPPARKEVLLACDERFGGFFLYWDLRKHVPVKENNVHTLNMPNTGFS
jgi:hypothetical protein